MAEPAQYEMPGISPRATAPALAAKLREWFPWLGGRAVAVTEAEINADNLPSMPLAMVALGKTVYQGSSRSNAAVDVSEEIILQFWFKPERYRRSDNTESPFYAYYDYWWLQDALIANLIEWQTPVGYKLYPRSLDADSDQYAITFTFVLSHDFKWCLPRPDVDEYGRPIDCPALDLRIRIPPKPGGFGGKDQPVDPCADNVQVYTPPAD